MRGYVAGPMRGLPEYNFPAFREAAALARACGLEVFSPNERDESTGFTGEGMTGFEDLAAEGFDLRAALHADMTFIAGTADFVLVLDGWENSSGARAETMLARALGIPVYRFSDLEAFALGSARKGPDVLERLPAVDVRNELTNAMLMEECKAAEREDFVPCIDSTFGPCCDAETGCAADPRTAEEYTRDMRRQRIDAQRAAAAEAVERTVSHLTPDVATEPEPPVDASPADLGIYVTDPTTGGRKGIKVERWDLMPWRELRLLARHYGINSVDHGGKYENRNWEAGYAWSLSYGALMRHLAAWVAGEDIDPETGTPHTVCVMWHAAFLTRMMLTHPELDDREKLV